MWTRHIAQAARDIAAFIAISVLRLWDWHLTVHLAHCSLPILPEWGKIHGLLVRGFIARSRWSFVIHCTLLSPRHGMHSVCHAWAARATGLLALAPFGHTPSAHNPPGARGLTVWVVKC